MCNKRYVFQETKIRVSRNVYIELQLKTITTTKNINKQKQATLATLFIIPVCMTVSIDTVVDKMKKMGEFIIDI